MEVHRPKEPIRSGRDFLKEIGIIVIGVLIALAAEQTVESLHWRHRVDAAEDAMRLELSDDDGVQALGRLAIAVCLDDALVRMDSAATHGAPAATLESLAQRYDPPIRVWDAEAWDAVVASDVGTHMSPARLVAWSAPYRLMPFMSDLNRQESEYAVDLHRAGPTSATSPSAAVGSYRRLVAQLRRIDGELAATSRVVLSRAHVLGADVPVTRQRALLDEARRRFGDCVVAPRLRSESGLSQFGGETDFRNFGLDRDSQAPRDPARR